MTKTKGRIEFESAVNRLAETLRDEKPNETLFERALDYIDEVTEQRDALHDLLTRALKNIDEFMLDDDYDAQAMLDGIRAMLRHHLEGYPKRG